MHERIQGFQLLLFYYGSLLYSSYVLLRLVLKVIHVDSDEMPNNQLATRIAGRYNNLHTNK